MLSFEPLSGGGLEIVDAIEQRRYTLDSSGELAPESADSDAFHFPVDRAVRVATPELVTGEMVEAFVRDEDGDPLVEVNPGVEERLDSGTYSVELNAPMKVYLRVESELSVEASVDRTAFEFGSGEVLVGARSYHQHPAATVTTTRDPEDVFAAVSHLSSALKTTSPERSYPTLRGHPPLVELGDERDVPDELHVSDDVRSSETGVRLELPPTLHAAFVAAPLAYYLGAELVPGDEPRLVADAVDYPLSEGTGEREDFETTVARTLKQVFFLDCLTRTEGYYRVDLYEREQVESVVDLDFDDLYDASLAAQLDAYLGVDFETLEPHLPQWPLVAYLDDAPESVEALPFVVNDLGVVRSADARPATPEEVQSLVLDSFLRGTPGRDSDGPTRSRAVQRRPPDAPDGSRTEPPKLVVPEESDALERAWFGDGVPLQATKALTTAFRNELADERNADAIDIAVVCNEREMAAEEAIAETVYGSRAELPFDVTIHRDCSTAELRAAFEADHDFLHYVGHVDEGGFCCRDGSFDATDLDVTGVRAFLLNACRSYEQGVALVEAGAVGGCVTLSDVVDGGAARVGRTMARLLNLGFPLRAALDLARSESIVGGHYLVVGDGSADVAQVEDGVPTLCDVETRDDGYDVTPVTYPSRAGRVGTMAYPLIEGNEQHFLVPGPLRTFHLSAEELEQYLVWHGSPVRRNGELAWNE